jgi:hypothetical protein
MRFLAARSAKFGADYTQARHSAFSRSGALSFRAYAFARTRYPGRWCLRKSWREWPIEQHVVTWNCWSTWGDVIRANNIAATP